MGKVQSPDPNVKVEITIWRRCLDWVDSYPRTGWYFAALLALNFIIDAIQGL